MSSQPSKSYAQQMVELAATYWKAGIPLPAEWFGSRKPQPIVFPSNWTLPGRCPHCGK